MIKRALTLDNALNITPRIFINDAIGPEIDCTTAPAKLASGKPLSWTKGQAADARLRRHGPPSEAVVVAVTNGRLDLGTWERIFSGQADRLARES
ncbi:MAG TPA: hypothetical protein VLY63_02370 [Anaerolineae bacterium]|nr:hypothetical protein [Anaerolineae bacterium]